MLDNSIDALVLWFVINKIGVVSVLISISGTTAPSKGGMIMLCLGSMPSKPSEILL
ncbi:hypothetical protein [Zhongshania sp.]|uniref:hypothetical protein n=1 Tax=Zhongshania sp. TaxID=1971902 RepID=UPI00356A96CD